LLGDEKTKMEELDKESHLLGPSPSHLNIKIELFVLERPLYCIL
jgi:hypothetical protein